MRSDQASDNVPRCCDPGQVARTGFVGREDDGLAPLATEERPDEVLEATADMREGDWLEASIRSSSGRNLRSSKKDWAGRCPSTMA